MVLAIAPIVLGLCAVLPDQMSLPMIALGLITVVFWQLYKQTNSAFSGNTVLVVTSSALALLLNEVIARLVIPLSCLDYRPENFLTTQSDMFKGLLRFNRNSTFRGTVHGDLAAMSGIREAREPREVEFITDERGFRNRPMDYEHAGGILLGDSFALGAGTTQNATVSRTPFYTLRQPIL